MAKAKTTRKQLFRAALAIADQTAEEWAVSEGITAGYLSAILNEHLTSLRLNDKIDAFIREQMSKVVALAS